MWLNGTCRRGKGRRGGHRIGERVRPGGGESSSWALTSHSRQQECARLLPDRAYAPVMRFSGAPHTPVGLLDLSPFTPNHAHDNFVSFRYAIPRAPTSVRIIVHQGNNNTITSLLLSFHAAY